MSIKQAKKPINPRSNLGKEIRSISTSFFAKHGYPSSTLRNIAIDAGVTAAAVYYHYKSKEDILRDIILEGLDRLTTVLQDSVENCITPIEEVEALVRAHLTYCATFTDEAKIITEESRFLKDDDYTQVRAKQVVILDIYVETITKNFPRDLIDDDQAKLLAFNTISVVLGWYRWYRPDHRVDELQAVNASVEFVMNSIIQKTTSYK